MGWRDVPMPPAVAALPRDKRGFPVPWVSEWNPGSWSIAHTEQYGAMIGSCEHVDGVGTPELGNLCAFRQVHGMLNRLCDVCGGLIGRNAYFMGNRALVERGYRELPVHKECALYAGQVCPGLVTPTKVDNVWVAKCRTYAMRPVHMTGPDPNVDTEEYDSFDDPRLLLRRAVGMRSVLTSIIAVPQDPQAWPLKEWVAMNLKRGDRMTVTNPGLDEQVEYLNPRSNTYTQGVVVRRASQATRTSTLRVRDVDSGVVFTPYLSELRINKDA